VRPLIEATPPRSAVRDELVRMAADRLDVPAEYLRPDGGARSGSGAGKPGAASAVGQGGGGAASALAATGEDRRAGAARPGQPARSSPPRLDASARAECGFLAMCLAEPSLGRDLLARMSDDHLSAPALRRVRDHLRAHFEDPLAEPPEDDPNVAALVRHVAMTADAEPSSEAALRLEFLLLDLRRVERQQRRARQARDYVRQRELAAERDRVQHHIADLMGQAA
jgi:hypothetical protein